MSLQYYDLIALVITNWIKKEVKTTRHARTWTEVKRGRLVLDLCYNGKNKKPLFGIMQCLNVYSITQHFCTKASE